MPALAEGFVKGQLFNDEMRGNCSYFSAEAFYLASNVGQFLGRFVAPFVGLIVY